VVELHELVDLTSLFDPPKFEQVISLNDFTRFSTPQNLKLIDYIKNQKVMILVDNGNTDNFIHHHIIQ
jgi:hypothetical protein